MEPEFQTPKLVHQHSCCVKQARGTTVGSQVVFESLRKKSKAEYVTEFGGSAYLRLLDNVSRQE